MAMGALEPWRAVAVAPVGPKGEHEHACTSRRAQPRQARSEEGVERASGDLRGKIGQPALQGSHSQPCNG